MNLDELARSLPATERELIALLRTMSQSDILAFIIKLTKGKGKFFRASFRIAKSCLIDNDSVYAFLKDGLSNSDISTIQNWLRIAHPKLGTRKLLSFMQKLLQEEPISVIRCRYWLGKMIAEDDLKLLDAKLVETVRDNQRLMDLLDL